MPAMTFTDILTKAGTPTGCGVLVVRRDGRVLTGTRKENATRGQICGPGGHIEPGETPKRAAKREAMEEFGIICNKLVPLGTQRTRGGYGTSAVFLCTDYIGKPMADEEEMTDPRWMTVEEIKEQEVFPPFLRSLKLLPAGRVAKTFDEIMKFNPYHGYHGYFSTAEGATSMTFRTNSKAGQNAIDNIKAKQQASGGTSDAVRNEVRKIESLIHKQSYESAAVIDKDGKTVLFKDGKENFVAFTPDETELMRGNTLTHNHPSSSVFSAEDIDLFISSELGEIRAVGKDGTHYSLKRGEEYTREMAESFLIMFKSEKKRAIADAQSELDERGTSEKIARGEMTINEANKEMNKLINESLNSFMEKYAPAYYLSYTVEKEESMGKSLNRQDITPEKGGEIVLDREANKELEDAFSEWLNRNGISDDRNVEKSTEFRIYKTDEDQHLVFGWASVAITVTGETLEDRQHDMIDPEDLEEAAYEYVLNFRDTGEEHLPGYRKRGRLVESCVFTPEKQRAMGIPAGTLPVAWWIGFKIDDEDTWQRVKNGTYRMFSIEGKAERLPVEKADRTARSFEEVLKYNHNHDARGRFASSPGGGGRSYGSTNTGDAMAEVRSGKHNSLEKHMDANGNLTPEREKVHKEIIDKLLEGKVGVEGQATMTMLGGGPASGKSSVMSADTSGDIHAVTVDPDTIKKMLPGFEEMAKVDTNAAAFYHEESSALAKRFAEVAFSENYNVIYDGTGDGGFSSVQKKIDGARANGYRVEAKYVTIDTEEAVRRNQKRYDDAIAEGKVPRLPPEETVRKTHAKVTDVAVTMAPQFDHIEVWDNNGARGHQKKIAEGGNGQHLKVTEGNQEAFQRFLEKSNSGAEGFITLPNGQVVPVDAVKG